jgi:hypothetical protein
MVLHSSGAGLPGCAEEFYCWPQEPGAALLSNRLAIY